MPNFPRTDAEILTLSDDLADGIENNPTVFATPPVTPAALRTHKGECTVALANQTQTAAIALAATATKATKFGTLTGEMKTVLNWAENLPGITNDQLHLIKWGKRAAPTALQKPGQCPAFHIVGINGHEVDFDWNKPREGGKPAGYKLLRRALGASAWTLHKVATRDEAEVSDLPAGTWELTVQPFNDAGDGPVSNTVSVTV